MTDKTLEELKAELDAAGEAYAAAALLANATYSEADLLVNGDEVNAALTAALDADAVACAAEATAAHAFYAALRDYRTARNAQENSND